MNLNVEEKSNKQPPPSRGQKSVVLAIAVAMALAAGNGYSIWHTHQLQRNFERMSAELNTQFLKIHEDSAASRDRAARELTELRQKLAEARQQVAVAVGQAKRDAQRRADRLAQELTSAVEAAQQRDREQAAEVANELNAVRQATDEKVSSVMTQVRSVSTEVDQTRTDLKGITAQLRSVVGDLGVQSGLIATNAQEIAALRALGERNYFEFDLRKSRVPLRAGDVQLWLKSSDPRRNKFTVILVADDRRIEKKDKTVNEPVQFYVSRARLPYELVINQVAKDRAVGYLATPKVQQAMR